MNAEQFWTAATSTRLQPKTITAAYSVIIESMGISDAARAAGMSRQQLSVAVQRIRGDHCRECGKKY